MSITATIAALQALHATISGVTSAPAAAEYPASFNGVALPIVLVYPADGVWQQQASGSLRRQDRVYRVQCFFQAVAQGNGIGSKMAACADLLQRFGEKYLDPASIALNNGTNQVTLKVGDGDNLQDQGVGTLAYAGVDYHGFELRVGVYEKWSW